MASVLGTQFIQSGSLVDLWQIGGLVLTDSNGAVTNINDGTVLDQDGEALKFPAEILSVAKSADAGDPAGTYLITLKQPWYKFHDIKCEAINPKPQATIVGTVAITAAVLVTLAGQTLQTDADVGANFTTTFSNPTTSVQSVADQINAGNAGTSVYADIVTDVNGLQYLRVRSTTGGTGSTLAINAASTGDTTLGMSNTTNTGLALGYMSVLNWNPKAHVASSQPASAPAAQTVKVIFAVGGVATAMPSAGFWLRLTLRNTSVGS